MVEELRNVSIRGRVAYVILCIEQAINHFQLDNYKWNFLFDLLWSFTSNKIGDWHYSMAESVPSSVLHDEYVKEEMDYLNKEEFMLLKTLYLNSNKVVNFMIDKIFEVGTRDMYSAVHDGSQDTLNYINEIINLMVKEGISIPDINLVKKFSILENDGWGREFKKKDVMK